VVAYARFLANELPKAVGLDAANGRRRSDGRAGHLCHGPYITLGPGRYTAGFYLQRGPGEAEGEVEIEVCNEHGRRVFANRTAPVKDLFASVDGLVHLDFALDSVERGCEVRLRVPARAHIEVSQAVLFRRDVSAWGGR
jgi:uncharacterized protein Veg